MKPAEIQALVDRLATKFMTVRIQGVDVRVGRLTVLDSLLIDLETGRNPLFELLDVQALKAGKHPPLSFELQSWIWFHGLRKAYPDITKDEADALLTLVDPAERLSIVLWILAGYLDESERKLSIGEAGKPILNIPAWFPLLLHLYPGYKLADLLELNATELSMLLAGVAEVQKFYALLIGGKKSKIKLADPLAVMYAPRKEGKHDKGREAEELD